MTLQRRVGIKRTAFGAKRERRNFGPVPANWPAQWQSEKDFQDQVEQTLHLHGWKFWHCNSPQMSEAGFPDLVCFRERIIWAELKVRAMNGKPGGVRPAQWAFIDCINKAGGEAYVWTWPDDFDALVEVVR